MYYYNMDQLCNIFTRAGAGAAARVMTFLSVLLFFIFIFFFHFTFQLTDHKENRNRSRVKIASHALSRALWVSLFDHMCLYAQLITFSRLVTLFFLRRCNSDHSREELAAINHFQKSCIIRIVIYHLHIQILIQKLWPNT